MQTQVRINAAMAVVGLAVIGSVTGLFYGIFKILELVFSVLKFCFGMVLIAVLLTVSSVAPGVLAITFPSVQFKNK